MLLWASCRSRKMFQYFTVSKYYNSLWGTCDWSLAVICLDKLFIWFAAQIGPNVEQQLNEKETQRDADWTITKELSCSICKNIFTEPVALQCGHSFCKTCVHDHWREKISRKCPHCPQIIHTEPQINFVLKSLSENYRERGGHRNTPESYQVRSLELLNRPCLTTLHVGLVLLTLLNLTFP